MLPRTGFVRFSGTCPSSLLCSLFWAAPGVVSSGLCIAAKMTFYCDFFNLKIARFVPLSRVST